MNNPSQIEEMKRYIFYEMSEVESEALEERFFEDNEYFEDLVELENDLIDSYAVKKLSGADLVRFEKSLAHSPERREKVIEARALQKIIEEERPREQEIAVAAPVGFWERLAAFFNVQASAMKLAVSALLVLIVCVVGILLYRDWQKREEFADDERRKHQIQELQEIEDREKQLKEKLERDSKEQEKNEANNSSLENSNVVLEQNSNLQNPAEVRKQLDELQKKKEELQKKLIIPATPKNEVKQQNQVIALVVSPLVSVRGGKLPSAEFVSINGKSKIILTVSVPEDWEYESIEVFRIDNGAKLDSQEIVGNASTVIFNLPPDVEQVQIRGIKRAKQRGSKDIVIGEFKWEIPKNKRVNPK